MSAVTASAERPLRTIRTQIPARLDRLPRSRLIGAATAILVVAAVLPGRLQWLSP